MLQLHEVRVPQWPFGKVTLFASPAKALRHLCDHVLTRPEANYWAQLIPCFVDYLDPDDDDSLYFFARSLWSDHPPLDVAQVLYDGYATVIVQAMSDAIRQDWFWAEDESDGRCWRGFGISGTYVVWRQQTIRSGMLLGYTAPPAEHEAPQQRRTNPLPRQHAWKYRGAIIRHVDADYPPMASDALKARYHVFKKGAVRVRREYKHACQARKVTEGGGYLGSLQLGVPDFDTWQRLQTSMCCAPCLFSLTRMVTGVAN
jgi:hypothetical protein